MIEFNHFSIKLDSFYIYIYIREYVGETKNIPFSSFITMHEAY